MVKVNGVDKYTYLHVHITTQSRFQCCKNSSLMAAATSSPQTLRVDHTTTGNAGINIDLTAATPDADSPQLPWSQEKNEETSRSLKRSGSSRSLSASPPPQRNWKLNKQMHKSQSVDLLADSKQSSGHEFGRFLSAEERRTHDDNSLKQKEGLFESLTRPWRRKSSKKAKDSEHPLHYPKNSEALKELLGDPSVDLNGKDGSGQAPIHAIITSKRRKSPALLLTLLSNSNTDVSIKTDDGETALHLAVKVSDILVVKILLTFEAEVNVPNQVGKTPLDVALKMNHMGMVDILVSVGGLTRDLLNSDKRLPRLMSFKDKAMAKGLPATIEEVDGEVAQNGYTNGIAGNGVLSGSQRESDFRERTFSTQSFQGATLKDMEDGKTLSTLYERLQQCINIQLELSGSFSASADEAIVLTMQQKELLKYKKTAQEVPSMFQVKNGSRILFLDGGGMRGLIQIEILRQLEKETGRQIIELFDWIVGTSTGGILALGLVYGKKTLSELRQLYFKIKEEVFANDRLGFAYNTEALESLLKAELGTELNMNSVQFPRVLITAVYKKTTMPELHFFNNCFGDEFSTYPVWKVARYTSAAPMLFSEFENYVDGGVLANNPSDYGLSAIQNFHRQMGERLDIALVLSVGCGIYPAEELGKVDAQEFLFFGKHWLKFGHTLKRRAQNLIQLLTTALVESEAVAKNTRSRLKELGIPFYRMSPHLDEVIPSGETDTGKLLDMVMKTKSVEALSAQMDELVQMFYLVAEMNKKQRDRETCEKKLKLTH